MADFDDGIFRQLYAGTSILFPKKENKICTWVGSSPGLYPWRVLRVKKEYFTLQKKPLF